MAESDRGSGESAAYQSNPQMHKHFTGASMRSTLKANILASALTLFLIMPLLGHADSGCEFAPPRSLKAHPASTSAEEGQIPPYRNRLSKESATEVRAFHVRQQQPGDSVQEQADGSERHFNLMQRQVVCGKSRDVLMLKISERTSENPNVSQAFTALKAMAMMGMHSEAEYQQAVAQYGATLKAYFRRVNSPDGGSADEGRLILDKYHKQEKQQRGQSAPATSQDKQQAAELRSKMQEMKARGDIAGMMQMAQQFQGGGQGDARKQQGQQEMNRDLWSLWMQCLKEMREAAYFSRLDYSSVQE